MVVTRPATALPSHSIDDIFAELSRLRQLVERLVVQPAPEREWLTIEKAAALLHRTRKRSVSGVAVG